MQGIKHINPSINKLQVYTCREGTTPQDILGNMVLWVMEWCRFLEVLSRWPTYVEDNDRSDFHHVFERVGLWTGGIFTLSAGWIVVIFPCKSRHWSEIPAISRAPRFDNWEIPTLWCIQERLLKKAWVIFPGLTWHQGELIWSSLGGIRSTQKVLVKAKVSSKKTMVKQTMGEEFFLSESP